MCNIDANGIMKDVIAYAQKVINEHPTLTDEVNGLLELCHSEIEQGESSEHEMELCMGDIEYLVEEL
jgi:hypothetical protein